MLVGEDQPVGGNEARRAAASQPDRRQPHSVQPGLVRRPAMDRFDLRGRKGIEGPHAFIGARFRQWKGKRAKKGCGAAGLAHYSLPSGCCASRA